MKSISLRIFEGGMLIVTKTRKNVSSYICPCQNYNVASHFVKLCFIYAEVNLLQLFSFDREVSRGVIDMGHIDISITLLKQ